MEIDTEGFENKVLEGFNDFLDIVNVIQFEYGLANLSSKYFLIDYFNDYSQIFKIGKLYPNGVLFYDQYNIDLENFIGLTLLWLGKIERFDRFIVLVVINLNYYYFYFYLNYEVVLIEG